MAKNVASAFTHFCRPNSPELHGGGGGSNQFCQYQHFRNIWSANPSLTRYQLTHPHILAILQLVAWLCNYNCKKGNFLSHFRIRKDNNCVCGVKWEPWYLANPPSTLVQGMLAGGASRGEGGLVSLVTFGGGGGYRGGPQQTKMMNQRIKEKVKPANISPPRPSIM